MLLSWELCDFTIDMGSHFYSMTPRSESHWVLENHAVPNYFLSAYLGIDHKTITAEDIGPAYCQQGALYAVGNQCWMGIGADCIWQYLYQRRPSIAPLACTGTVATCHKIFGGYGVPTRQWACGG